MKNFTASASSHPRMPAMFGALSAQLGVGLTGLKSSAPPRSSLPAMGSPFASCSLWHLPQWATEWTRYFPRATLDAAGLADWANDKPLHNINAMVKIMILFFIFNSYKY